MANNNQPHDIIDLTEEDDSPPLKRAKVESYSDEIQIVDAPTEAPLTTAAASNTTDVAVVGIKNHVRLPHMRQHCTECLFAQGNHSATCHDCYCYICDIPARDCTEWNTHCHATDKGPQASYYKRWRDQNKTAAKPPADNDNEPPDYNPLLDNFDGYDWYDSQDDYNGGGYGNGDGYNAYGMTATENKNWNALQDARKNSPFPPSTVSPHPSTTQCRHCQWYSVLKDNPSWSETVFCYDWCQACGRVASASALGQSQGNELQDPAGAVYLGMKTIDYQVHAHDPRTMKAYTKYYDQHNFAFNEVDTAEEFVQHRLGNLPTLRTLLKAIPMGGTAATIAKDGAIEEASRYGQTSTTRPADDTQAILVQPDDLMLLQVLDNAAERFGKNEQLNMLSHSLLAGDIRNKYDRDTQTGTLTIRVFSQGVTGKDCKSALKLAKFLGVWFGVLPFGLEELNLHMAVHSSNQTMNFARPKDTVRKEMGLTDAQIKAATRDARKEVKGRIDDHCNATKASRKKHLSLTSSSGSKNMGGICLAETYFRSMMLRLFREIVADCVTLQKPETHKPYPLTPFLSDALGIPSCHRMGASGHELSNRMERMSLAPFLGPKDAQLVAFCFSSAAREIVSTRVKSLNGVMDQLENLGHAPAPFVDGLTVELLPFQAQSLQWALERETTPGGVQSFFWTKLPNTQVYYNPILGRLTKEKPKLVRGGIIAEQMGLGKTVISLALILQNPSPAIPIAGSDVSTIPTQIHTNGSFRDPDLYERTKNESGNRGKIMSGGTLVVCPVSLVGQWIEEAKSKLKEPGLVYSYHGGSRKRDPAILAQNSIVVTTYETLSSDDTFHRNKSNDPDYCPPCEQIRWWRILCDESHGIRNASNGKSRAVMKLVADNKWLVSGTPLSTTVMDLKNQLKFLGIEHHSALMDVFKDTMLGRVNDSSRPSKRSQSWYGSSENSTPGLGYFNFTMRPLLMRHSQNQKYLDTNTTLMSLPPKTERTIEVNFSLKEKEEYKKLEQKAQIFYTAFCLKHKEELTKHFLKLTAKLVPLRIACAGGNFPLDDPGSNDKVKSEDVEDDAVDGDIEDEENVGKKKRQKREQRFSDFAFTSKFRALIRELCRLRDTDASAKSLVFSQYASTLKWLQEELPKHGFQFRTLSGDMSMRARAKALRDFQNDPPTTIFLLSMRAGAVGINLTQANRVFLMEPCFNPALEAQAIGRVHRLGQKRPVEIIRLIVKDSVETRIETMLKKKFGNSATSPMAKPPPSSKKSTTQSNKKKKSTSTADENDENSEQDNDQKKAAKEVASSLTQPPVNVSSLSTDKLVVMTDEFDLLFGVNAHRDPAPAEDSKPSAVAKNQNSTV